MTTATATHPEMPAETAGVGAESLGCAQEHPACGERGAVRRWRKAVVDLAGLVRGDAGMSTAEYAIGTIAAAAFASVLYTVVSGDTITGALTSLIERALQESF